MQDEMNNCHRQLTGRAGKGNDYLGWIDLPVQIEAAIMARIQAECGEDQEYAEIFVVIGIGGSLSWSRAMIEALGNPFEDLNGGSGYPYVVFAGGKSERELSCSIIGIAR